MSNSSNYNGGSTLLEVPTALSGASPTSYFCGNLLLKQLVQQKKSSPSPVKAIVTAPVVALPLGYSQLQSATSFLEQCPSAEINKQDHKGNTPLHYACLEGQEELVQLLLDNNAAVDSQNFVGETALFLAASYGRDGVVMMLLEHGANASISTIDGVSPVHMASANGLCSTLEVLYRYGSFMNIQDDCGDTPLHYAVREGQLKVCDQLVTRCNADVDICNEDQEAALDLALSLDMSVDFVQFLSKFSKASTRMETMCY